MFCATRSRRRLLRLGAPALLVLLFGASSFPRNFANPDSSVQVSYSRGTLIVSSPFFERRFRYDSTSALHSFYPSAWIDRRTGKDLLLGDGESWFALCVDGEVIRVDKGGWDYRRYQTRKLANGGTDIAIRRAS